MQVSLGDILPHLSERGKVEVDLAIQKCFSERLTQEVLSSRQVIAHLQEAVDRLSAEADEEKGDDAPKG